MLNNYTPIKYKPKIIEKLNNPEKNVFTPSTYCLIIVKINIIQVKMKCKRDLEAKNNTKINESQTSTSIKNQRTVTHFLTSPSKESTKRTPSTSQKLNPNKFMEMGNNKQPPKRLNSKIIIKKIVSKKEILKPNEVIFSNGQKLNISERKHEFKPLIKSKYYSNKTTNIKPTPVVKTSRSSSVKDSLFTKFQSKKSEESFKLVTRARKHEKNLTLSNLSSNNFLINTTRELENIPSNEFIQNRYRSLLNGFLK
jgi:hypothetical protein